MIGSLFNFIACSALWFALYMLLLRRERMPGFNRYFLLAGIPVSLIIPFLTLKGTTSAIPTVSNIASMKTPANLSEFLLPAYIIISTLLLLRFVRNLYRIQRLIRISRRTSIDGAGIVLVKESILPHTFLQWIFLSESDYNDKRIEAELFTHELAHVKQRHSLDILLIELLQVFLWFNPFVLLFKKQMRLNHEFLADAAVIRRHESAEKYMQLLLSKTAGTYQLGLSSGFHFQSIRNRMIMLGRPINYKKHVLKIILTLFIAFLLLPQFSKSATRSIQDSSETLSPLSPLNGELTPLNPLSPLK